MRPAVRATAKSVAIVNVGSVIRRGEIAGWPSPTAISAVADQLSANRYGITFPGTAKTDRE
jgi:hypothetical protein